MLSSIPFDLLATFPLLLLSPSSRSSSPSSSHRDSPVSCCPPVSPCSYPLISQLPSRFADIIDAHNLSALPEVFIQNATANYTLAFPQDGIAYGIPAIAAQLGEYNFTRGFHDIGTIVVDVPSAAAEDGAQATVTSTYVATFFGDVPGDIYTTYGRWISGVVHTPHGWKMNSMTAIPAGYTGNKSIVTPPSHQGVNTQAPPNAL